MTDSIKFRVRRGEEEIGSWDQFDLRQYIASGSLLPSDEVYDENDDRWIPLVPPFRRKWNMFDWSEDNDSQWYYVLEGYIHGPRLFREIEAMHSGGYLSDEILVSQVGTEDWIEFKDVVVHTATEHAKDALDKLLAGDAAGAGVSGFKAIGKAWKAFTEPEAITSEWLCVDKSLPHAPEDSEIVFAVNTAGYHIIESECLGAEVFAMRFGSIDEATQVRDSLEFKEVGDGGILTFSNRSEHLTSEDE